MTEHKITWIIDLAKVLGFILLFILLIMGKDITQEVIDLQQSKIDRDIAQAEVERLRISISQDLKCEMNVDTLKEPDYWCSIID